MKFLTPLAVIAYLFSDAVVADISGTATITDNDSSSGTVNFLDPFTYTKPAYIDATTYAPIDTTPANTYYVNLSAGSNGTGTCIGSGNPCNSLNSLSGKTTTGGTVVYLKGNGRMDITSGTFAGSTGDHIYIQPWPSDSTPTVLTAAGGCTTTAANRLDSSGWHHILWDGGPDMLLRFVGSGCTGNQNGYDAWFNSDNLVFWRTRFDAANSGGPAVGLAVNEGANTSSVYFINVEVYNANNYYGFYMGGGATCVEASSTVLSDIKILGSIIRQVDGRPIQIEPRDNSSGVVVAWNAIHDVGWGVNTGSISAATNPADACGGTTENVDIFANLGWNLGAGGASLFQSTSTDAGQRVMFNTYWDYAKAAATAQTQSHGITGPTSGTNNGTVEGNIVIDDNGNPAGLEPIHFVGGYVTNDNVCDASPCGSTPVSTTATEGNIFDSIDPNASNFLHPAGAALGNCLVRAGFEIDYLGANRGSVGAATDCGAINEP